jgi:hypothetical protein
MASLSPRCLLLLVDIFRRVCKIAREKKAIVILVFTVSTHARMELYSNWTDFHEI